MTEQLIFNGIDGESGSYGLEPMTGEELARHIRGSSRDDSREREKLERQLLQNSAKKIIEIVRFLTKCNFEDVARDAAWEDNWRRELARLLASEVLGDEHTGSGQVKRLEERLRGHTEEKVVDIVTFLAEAKSKELAKLLLEDQDEEPDNIRELKEQLKKAAMDRLFEIRRDQLSRDRIGVLEGDVGAQRAWLQEMITALRLVPIKALNSLDGVSIQTRDALIAGLDTLPVDSAAPLPWLLTLRQNLGELPRAVSWNDLLDELDDGLQAAIEARDGSILWASLFSALEQWLDSLRRPLAHLGLVEGVDPTKLAEAGWGIIFPHQEPGATPTIGDIKEALQPLLELRRSQAGDLFKLYEGADGYRPMDTASTWLHRKPRNARVADPADPKKVPYYLLVVGSPEEIPFHFQYQLDVQYAVGRIDFGGDLEAYTNYARNVVATEDGSATFPRKVTFFGVSNPGDRATELSAKHLVKPLQEQIGARYGTEWQIDAIEPQDAKKAELKRLLGAEKPSLLFAACHGMEFPKDAPEGRQARYQGALLCQDWDGPAVDRGQVPREFYLAGEDLADDADLQGLIAFFFACYSAGTPPFDEYTKQAFKENWETIADPPFVAALPKAMLGLSKGALAVIGHVERAWGFSYLGDRETEQIAVFQSAVERLLKGHPVGSAMEYFNMRYAALSTELTSAQANEIFGMVINDYELAEMWTANNDAKGYVVIGDPAVRLPGIQTG
ncbi:MAG: hypothetical protein PVI80_01025 [Anaerolineae bacterium]